MEKRLLETFVRTTQEIKEVDDNLLKLKQITDKPDKLNTWFYMVMKELRRNSYKDMIESWGISDKEDKEVREYINNMIGVNL